MRLRKEQGLVAGIHEFPFEFQLPDNIPSSYSSKYGSIRYVMSSQIQTKRKVIQFGRILALPVQRNADLSKYPKHQKHYIKSEKVKDGLLRLSGEISFSDQPVDNGVMI